MRLLASYRRSCRQQLCTVAVCSSSERLQWTVGKQKQWQPGGGRNVNMRTK